MKSDKKKHLKENDLASFFVSEEESSVEAPDQSEDDWYVQGESRSKDFEKEPTQQDVKKQSTSLVDIHKKQAELRDLEDKKDALLMQLKSNIISLDQYREQIGNIPTQIKKLRAGIEAYMNMSVEDEGEFAN